MLTGNTGQTLTSIINTMTEVVTMSVPWLLLFLLFYWNIYKIIFESDNAEKRKQAIPRLVWSIIALTIVFSLGGIINILSNTLLGTGSSTFAPAVSAPSQTPAPAPTSGTPAPSSGSPSGGSAAPVSQPAPLLFPGQQQI